jgi:hypothetical protein
MWLTGEEIGIMKIERQELREKVERMEIEAEGQVRSQWFRNHRIVLTNCTVSRLREYSE